MSRPCTCFFGEFFVMAFVLLAKIISGLARVDWAPLVNATVELNVLKIVGAFRAPSETNSTINLTWRWTSDRDLACAANREAQPDSCELRHLARAADREAQLDSCWLGPWFEMEFDNQMSTKNCCCVLWYNWLDPTINWKVNGILLLILLRRKDLNGLFDTTGSHTNNAKVLHKIAVLMESSLAIEKAFDNERSTKSCCRRLWNFWMNPTINLNANSFDLLWHLARATNWKMQLVSCDLRHCGRAANREAQLDLWWSNFAAS
jgi:hypothetical protein